MQIHYNLPSTSLALPTLVSIGNFDGVHLGHQALVRDMVSNAHASGLLAGVVTFDPHPLRVLVPERRLHYITSPEERIALLAELGIDFAILHPFTRETARTPARAFVMAVLERLRMLELWVGPDFALGRDQEGDIAALHTMGEELGFVLRVVPHICLHGHSVRSTRVRALLQEGDVAEVASLLGRYYSLPGEIVAGVGRGRGLGFPTANLAVCESRVIPASGIYAGWAQIGELCVGAAINIGVRPTFPEEDPHPSVEAHLLDHQGTLYGQQAVLSFVERLRGERRFDTASALAQQIAQDVATTRDILGLPAEEF